MYAYEADADILFEDGLMIGATPGQFSITIRDQFGPRSTQVDVVVVESLKMEPKIINDHTQLGKLIAVNDLNQDGVRDFIVTEPENDTGSANGGLVAVYHSTDGEFEGGPVQVFTGAERDDELGRGVAVGDINGDGLSDLLYGIFRSDVNGANSGAMYMHLGQPDGRFSEAPDQVFDGPQNDGYYGSAIAICDFNGDERMDLAVASWGYEDRDWRPRSYNHGAVMVHLGYPDGFLPQPDQIIVGREPDDDGNWYHGKIYLWARLWRRVILTVMGCATWLPTASVGRGGRTPEPCMCFVDEPRLTYRWAANRNASLVVSAG